MTILDYTREQIQEFINSGFMEATALRHYDICKALKEGKTQTQVSDVFNYNDSAAIRKIKAKKCPDCGKTRNI